MHKGREDSELLSLSPDAERQGLATKSPRDSQPGSVGSKSRSLMAGERAGDSDEVEGRQAVRYAPCWPRFLPFACSRANGGVSRSRSCPDSAPVDS